MRDNKQIKFTIGDRIIRTPLSHKGAASIFSILIQQLFHEKVKIRKTYSGHFPLQFLSSILLLKYKCSDKNSSVDKW